MTRPRKRPSPLSVLPLERRCLLSGTPTAVWIGQDGHDLAGGASPLVGNGVQDVHVVLYGLPADRAIGSMQLLGYGGGGWVVNVGPYNPVYSGAAVRSPGATAADLYLDPYTAETGRRFDIVLTYDDQSTAVFAMTGGAADPNLRMPDGAVSAQWAGQDGTDLTGPGPAVGPDGVQDAHLTLAHLFPATPVAAVTVTDAAGRGWAYGTNPGLLNNAEFVRSGTDPARGDLYFSPGIDLSGRAATVTVTYADGKVDATGIVLGHTDPTLAAPAAPPVAVAWNVLRARWLGQDGRDLVGPSDVHLDLGGLPAGRSVTSAVLSDQAGVSWAYARPGSGDAPADPSARPLGFQPSADPTRADLSFPPVRDETGATLTLVIRLDDGSRLAARLPGGAADPGLRAPDVAPTVVVARPGDDLNDLAGRFGTVRLSPGLYVMSRPLVLDRPVTITAAPGTTLLFDQPAGDPGWTAAIKVRSSHTTLDGFAVRFAGPVRWAAGVSYGPAVVGTTDNLDAPSPDPLVALAFTHLDLQGPAPATAWEEAPSLFRLVSAGSGRVQGNRMKGGLTEVVGGPWQVTGNVYLGTVPGTFTYGAFAGHYTHDLTVAENLVAPSGPSGKTWRFLVLTQSGTGDVVRDNTVRGVGPMDNDTVENPNAPETILTEAYRLHFEGFPTSISPDGLVVQIPTPQGTPARTGDALAILTGPQAGQWRTVVQALSPTAYLLDAPVTPGRFAVSLATGFVNETFQRNTVDARGSSTAHELVLAGNVFGANVLNNHFVGGGLGFQISGYPSEAPNVWGWSRAPVMGVTVQGNTVEDSATGGRIEVLNSPAAKSVAGRVYVSVTLADNTGVWSAPYLAARAKAGVTDPPTFVTVGDALSVDPGNLLLTAAGNRVVAPGGLSSGPMMRVVAATVNGVAGRNVGVVLTSPPGRPLVSSRLPVTVPVGRRPAPAAGSGRLDARVGFVKVAGRPAGPAGLMKARTKGRPGGHVSSGPAWETVGVRRPPVGWAAVASAYRWVNVR